MRDFGPVHVTTYGNVLSISTLIEIVPAADGGNAAIGGNLSYVLTEEQRRIVAEIRRWRDE
ncbi:hypothetical protein FM104_14410 [Microbacterium esteraromaticum]|uniref:Uncharacterized protein n=2 Tax=Microbacterium esteraromaticum TaxID=57043 RepID=A0A1R4KPE3_9MICO|nr:hypothetical protein FM104_14410 [Microbacterium esteraromaticum]